MTAGDETCVREVNGDAEAQQLRAFLEAHGIPCELRGDCARVVYGLTLDGLGVVRVCVPPDLGERARNLLARVDAGELTLAAEADIEPS